jgi:glycosyltransferase involved in cell wall biosynthesis
MSAPLKLLHVYQNSRVGGIQQQILGLIGAYNRSIVAPAFCSLLPLGEIGREIERLGVPVFSVDMPPRASFSPAAVLRLRGLLQREGIQVVRTHKYRANLHGVTAARLAGVPVVIASQHSEQRLDHQWTRRALNRRVLSRCDRVVAVSASIREHLIGYDQLDPDRVLLMRNGVDTEVFSPTAVHAPVRAELGLDPGVFVIGFVGRLATIKGLPHLLEAMRHLTQSRPVALVVIGDGPQRREFEDRAKDLRLADRVIFTGERRDIAAALAAMDVFCLPSLAEGLPNVLLEAMSMALPIVTTAVGGIPDLIHDGDAGLLVAPGDAQALATAIARVAADHAAARAMGGRARALIVATRSIQSAARAWEALYVQVAGEKLGPRHATLSAR